MQDQRPTNRNHPKKVAIKTFPILQTTTGCNLLEVKRLRRLALPAPLTRPQRPAHRHQLREPTAEQLHRIPQSTMKTAPRDRLEPENPELLKRSTFILNLRS